MTQLNLGDIGGKNENYRRYTWAGPNYKHRRLDYFLISSDLVRCVQEKNIEIRYKSDHNLISVTLKFVDQE